jgi:hypothetical protein
MEKAAVVEQHGPCAHVLVQIDPVWARHIEVLKRLQRANVNFGGMRF